MACGGPPGGSGHTEHLEVGLGMQNSTRAPLGSGSCPHWGDAEDRRRGGSASRFCDLFRQLTLASRRPGLDLRPRMVQSHCSVAETSTLNVILP